MRRRSRLQWHKRGRHCRSRRHRYRAPKQTPQEPHPFSPQQIIEGVAKFRDIADRMHGVRCRLHEAWPQQTQPQQTTQHQLRSPQQEPAQEPPLPQQPPEQTAHEEPSEQEPKPQQEQEPTKSPRNRSGSYRSKTHKAAGSKNHGHHCSGSGHSSVRPSTQRHSGSSRLARDTRPQPKRQRRGSLTHGRDWSGSFSSGICTSGRCNNSDGRRRSSNSPDGRRGSGSNARPRSPSFSSEAPPPGCTGRARPPRPASACHCCGALGERRATPTGRWEGSMKAARPSPTPWPIGCPSRPAARHPANPAAILFVASHPARLVGFMHHIHIRHFPGNTSMPVPQPHSCAAQVARALRDRLAACRLLCNGCAGCMGLGRLLVRSPRTTSRTSINASMRGGSKHWLAARLSWPSRAHGSSSGALTEGSDLGAADLPTILTGQRLSAAARLVALGRGALDARSGDSGPGRDRVGRGLRAGLRAVGL